MGWLFGNFPISLIHLFEEIFKEILEQGYTCRKFDVDVAVILENRRPQLWPIKKSHHLRIRLCDTHHSEKLGSTPECNSNAVVVLFRHFPAREAGRILFCVLTGLIFILYTVTLIKDHIPPATKKQMRDLILKIFVWQIPDRDAEQAEAHSHLPQRRNHLRPFRLRPQPPSMFPRAKSGYV